MYACQSIIRTSKSVNISEQIKACPHIIPKGLRRLTFCNNCVYTFLFAGFMQSRECPLKSNCSLCPLEQEEMGHRTQSPSAISRNRSSVPWRWISRPVPKTPLNSHELVCGTTNPQALSWLCSSCAKGGEVIRGYSCFKASFFS